MNRLLSIEWIKLRKYKAFWVLLLLFALACVGINSFMYHFQGKIKTGTSGIVKLSLFDSQNIWPTTAWLNYSTILLPGVLMIFLLSNEFTYKTLRQVIINGFSRTQAIVSKWLLILVLAVICWAIYVLTVLIMGSLFLGTKDLFTNFQYAGYSFIKIVLGLSVAFLLSLWIKRSGLTIAIYLVYSLFIESILVYFLDKINGKMGHFLPLNSGASLTPNPLNKLLERHTEMVSQPAAYWYLFAAVLWIAIIFFISLRYIRRADL